MDESVKKNSEKKEQEKNPKPNLITTFKILLSPQETQGYYKE